MDAMIFAAGKGSRLHPWSLTKPKALVEVGGKPILGHLIEKLLDNGFDNIVVNAFHFSEQIVEYIAKDPIYRSYVSVVVEKDELLNTGGGLENAKRHFHLDQPILLHNVDIWSDINLKALYQYHRESGGMATLSVSERSSSRYLLFNQRLRLCGWENRDTGERIIKRCSRKLFPYAFCGVHVIDAGLLSLMPKGKPYSIVDFYLNQCYYEKILAYVQCGHAWTDLGTLEAVKKVNHDFRKKNK